MGVASNTGTIPTEKGMIVCSGVAECIVKFPFGGIKISIRGDGCCL